MKIHSYFADWKNKWDGYVQNSSQSTFFHLIGWKNILEKTFGYKPHYLLAECEDKICRILPLFLVNNLISGKVEEDI